MVSNEDYLILEQSSLIACSMMLNCMRFHLWQISFFRIICFSSFYFRLCVYWLKRTFSAASPVSSLSLFSSWSFPLSSGGGHRGEFTVRERLSVHSGWPNPTVQHWETPGQWHQPHQRGEEERQRQGREGEEEAAAAGGREGERQGKSQEGHAEGTWRHVQVKL